MSSFRALYGILLLIVLGMGVGVASAYARAPLTEEEGAAAPSLAPEKARLARRLKGEVIAPCCWRGTVDTHNSSAAEQVAEQIDRMVRAGKSREEILDRLVDEYGERILARPRAEGFGAVFYWGPLLALIGGAVGVSIWLKKNSGGDLGGARDDKASPDLEGGASGRLGQEFEEMLRRVD